MAVWTPGLARRDAGGWPGQGKALEAFADLCFSDLSFSRGEKSLAAQYRRAGRCHAPYCSMLPTICQVFRYEL
jgi:hypothetical protein